MTLSIHVAQIFLESVMNKTSYTCLDVDLTIRYLEKLFIDIVLASYAKLFVIPGFEDYIVI